MPTIGAPSEAIWGQEIVAATPRVDWATLMRRSFAVDVLQCPTFGGRLRVRGDITEPTLVRQVLERLAIPWEAPPVARARDPTLLFADEAAD